MAASAALESPVGVVAVAAPAMEMVATVPVVLDSEVVGEPATGMGKHSR